MPNIVFGGKIRSFHPESLPASAEEKPAETASVPRPVARPKEVPVMREEVMGLKFSQFPQLPPELWNHLTSALRDRLKDMCQTFAAAYQEGIDERLTGLLDIEIPRIARQIGRDSMEAVLSKERGFLGTHIQCHECDDQAEFHEDVSKSILTPLGAVPTRRSYYVCPSGHTFYPQDALLGVDGEHRILPSLQEHISLLTSKLAYSQAVDIVERLLHIDISVETAERVTATVAGLVQTKQDGERKDVLSGDDARLPEPMAVSSAEVGIVAADGGFCRIRKQQEQSEFKVGVVGTMVPLPGQPLVDPETGEARKLPPTKDKLYLGHFADVDDFFEYLTVEYFRRGLNHCSVVQFLADGAEPYWTRFPDLVQPGQEAIFCLDFFHARDYIRDAAEAIFAKKAGAHPAVEGNARGRPPVPLSGSKPPQRLSSVQQGTKPDTGTPQRAWYDRMQALLLEGRLDDFFDELNRHGPSPEADETEDNPVVTAQRYFQKRRHLLRYKECIDRGLPIGSGMIEGGVRFVAKDRLDRPGTKWTRPGAEAILQLRCLDAGRRWKGFFENVAAERIHRYNALKSTWLSAA